MPAASAVLLPCASLPKMPPLLLLLAFEAACSLLLALLAAVPARVGSQLGCWPLEPSPLPPPQPKAGGRPDGLALTLLLLRPSSACPLELGGGCLPGGACSGNPSASADKLPEEAAFGWRALEASQGCPDGAAVLLAVALLTGTVGCCALRCRKGMPTEGGPALGGPLSWRLRLARRLTGSCGAGARKLSDSCA
jgi:hypothetical protein